MIRLADFDAQFAKHLANTRRWGAFRMIVADLIARGRPVNIVETGCARQPDNWAGDGQSTEKSHRGRMPPSLPTRRPNRLASTSGWIGWNRSYHFLLFASLGAT